MDDFDYSLEALAVLSMFHDSDVMIYVEGEDDKCFWKNMCDLASLTNYYIESVGGSENLIPKIDLIIQNGAKIIVAKDREYSDVDSTNVNHVQIVTTCGHSIENTLYCPQVISDVINSFSKTSNDLTKIIKHWYDDFCNTAEELIHYDIVNNINKKGISIFGDNCTRFLTTDKAVKLSKTKIDNFINSIAHNFQAKELKEYKIKVNAYQGERRYLIKGHFLTNAIINMIKLLAYKLSRKSLNLPHTNLYSLCINGCKICGNLCSDLKLILDNLVYAYKAVAI